MLARLALGGLLLLAATGSGEGCEAPSGFTARERLAVRDVVVFFRTVPPAIEVGRHFTVEAIICAPATLQRLRIDARMPEHNHGMNYRPTIALTADGRWQAEGLMFHMPGRWQLVFDVDHGGRTERLATDLLLE